MRSLIWLRKLFSWVLGHLGWGGAARADKPPRRDDFVPLFVTRLEERRVLSTITVTGTGDDVVNGDGEVTLREAITAANTDTSVDGSTAGSGNDEIVFDASLAGQTITLDGNQLPTITGANGDLTITGLGARLLSIDGDGLSRILEVSVGANVEVSGLTLTGGNSGNVSGGAILSAGDLTITASQIENNTAETAGGGGGIFSNNAVLTIVDTTISGNTSNGTGAGGGIYNNGGTLTISTARSPAIRLLEATSAVEFSTTARRQSPTARLSITPLVLPVAVSAITSATRSPCRTLLSRAIPAVAPPTI